VNLVSTWYISCLISNTLESPLSIENMWISAFFSALDSVHFSLYVFMGSYIYPFNAYWWCTLPKVACTIAYLIVLPDTIYDMILRLIVSNISNYVHLLVCEEVMVNFKHKNEGSTLLAYSLTQMNVFYICRVVMANINNLINTIKGVKKVEADSLKHKHL